MRQVIVGLFLLWTLFVLFATSARGSGLSPDSMSYLAAAESIAHGTGPRVPMASWSEPENHSRLRHFPPLFPLLIALPVALGVPAAEAARWLEALAAGTLAALLACIGARAVGRAGALVVGMSVMLAPAVSLCFFMVLSEPVFLMFWALSLFVMLRAPTASWALGCAAACCALTRYAGISVVAAAVLWMLWQRGTLQQRCTRALIAALPALVSLTFWRAWSGGEFRRYAWYADGLTVNLREAWATLQHALLPLPPPLAAQLWQAVLLAAMAVLLLMAAPRRGALFRACALMTCTYLGVVVASRLRADPEIPFDWRILSPVILSCQLTLTVALVQHWDRWRSIAARSCMSALGSVWLGLACWNAAHNVTALRDVGALYDAADWQDSAFARWLRTEGRGYALYSNDPPALWHLDHRSSWLLPELSDAATLAALQTRLRERPSAVLGFRGAFAPTAEPSQLAADLGLTSRQCFEQVCVWTATGPMADARVR